MRRLSAVLFVAGALAGCNRVHAKTAVAPPPLATPAPPDRVIVPAAIPEQVEAPPAPQPPALPPARPQVAAPPPQRPAAPAPAAPVSPTPEPPATPPILQTTSNPAELEQRALTMIGAAQRDLDRINPSQLGANARAQFDTAKGFVRQAEAALKVKNVVLARELADKAAALASQLGR